MNKKIKTLIIGGVALVLLVGVLLLLLFLPQQETESEESSATVSTTTVEVYTGEVDNVSALTVDQNGVSYEIVRDGEEFTIEALEGDGVSILTSELSNTVTQFASVTATRLVEENPTDLTKYGLDNPAITVDVTYADGTSHQVKLGNALPTDDGYYTLVDDGTTVYATGTSKYTCAAKRALDYVSTEVIETWTAPTDADGNATQESAVINYLEIEGATFADLGTFRMEAQEVESGDGVVYSSGYRIVSPFEADFRIRTDEDGNDQNAIYTSNLSAFSADSVAYLFPEESDLTACGFDAPYAAIRFARDGEDHVWTVGNQVEGSTDRYLMADDKPIIYQVAEAKLPWITADINNLFSTLMILPHINDVAGVDIMVNGQEYIVEMSGEDDALVAVMNGTELSTDIFRKFYQYLLSAPAEGLNLDGEKGELLASFTYHYKDTSVPDDTVQFYDAGNRRVIISLNGNDTYISRSTYVDVLAKNCEKVLAGETPILDY